MPSLEEIRAAPKVLLHDHLDGGLRAATVVDLARNIGYDRLPSHDVDEVAVWLQRGASRGHLNLYLDAFQHTLAVMQTREALIRVAAECAEDLAADGVVYAEVRFAPELHVAGGLSLNEVVEAVLEGFRIGSEGRGITMYALLTAMRTAARSLEIAELAVRYRDRGVAGFDIAGAEAGWPPSRHLDAFQYVARENFHITIHAGEGFGLPSIWEALQWCGAERLGHGVRIVDDIRVTPEGTVELGRLASYVRDRRIPLEMCPTSNVQTGAAAFDRGAPDPAAPPAVLPCHGEHGQPADERRDAVLGVPPPGRDVRLRLVGHRVADDQRDEERLRALRRAAPDHQHDHQAGLRHRPRGQRLGGAGPGAG